MSALLEPPLDGEYADWHAGYVALVPSGDVRDHLRTQVHETIALLSGVSEDRAEQSYGPGKWTLKEVVLHMCDTERVFAYRLLRIARGDRTPLPGFEQDEWVPHSCANRRTVASLLLEYTAIHSDDATRRLGPRGGMDAEGDREREAGLRPRDGLHLCGAPAAPCPHHPRAVPSAVSRARRGVTPLAVFRA